MILSNSILTNILNDEIYVFFYKFLMIDEKKVWFWFFLKCYLKKNFNIF